MSGHQAGKPRVSSTMTKSNPRPRKYATASERQAAYRARAPEVCFRAEAKTVDTLDRIADTLDQSRADVLLSMTKFALANHDWARFGLTHKPLPYGYGMTEERAENPQPIWKRTRPKSLGKPVPLTPKQKAIAKRRAAAAGRKYPNLVDNIAASRMENPTVKKPTPAQLAARARFAEMARSGAFKKKAATKRKKNPLGVAGGRYEILWGGSGDLKASYDDLGQAKDFLDDIDRPPGLFYGRDTKTGKHFFSFAAMTKFPNIEIRGTAMQKAYKANPAKKTVSQKISQLTREGYPQKQAVAIALEEQRRGKVKATPRKRNPISQVAQTIYEQIGGGRFAAMTGAKNFVAGEDFLQFSIPRNQSGANKVRISYHYGSDFYTLAFIKVYKDGSFANVQVFEDATADQLQPLFTKVTGMQTSLGTMGRKSNPATGLKKSRTKLNPAGAKLYTVSRADANGNPVYHLAHFRKMADAKAYAQAYADANKTRVTITSKVL